MLAFCMIWTVVGKTRCISHVVLVTEFLSCFHVITALSIAVESSSVDSWHGKRAGIRAIDRTLLHLIHWIAASEREVVRCHDR